MLINKNFTKKQYPERRRHVFPNIFAAKVTYFFFIQNPNLPSCLPEPYFSTLNLMFCLHKNISNAFDTPSKPSEAMSNAFDTPPDPLEAMSNAFDTPSKPSEIMSNAFDTSSNLSEMMSNAFDTPSKPSEGMDAMQTPCPNGWTGCLQCSYYIKVRG